MYHAGRYGLRLARLLRCLALIWLGSIPLGAAATDIHWLWDDRCAECHGHSADFARSFLRITDNRLLGRHQFRELHLFLGNHYTPERDVDAVYNMLQAQVLTVPRYREECSACHGGAAEFIRNAMLIQSGTLTSRATRQPIDEFMQSHRRLDPQSIEFYLRLLKRVANEVYGE